MVFPVGELESHAQRMRRDVIELANAKTHWQKHAKKETSKMAMFIKLRHRKTKIATT